MIRSRQILLFLLLSIACSTVSAEDTIRLASGEWPPYQSNTLKHGGVVSRVIRDAFMLEGVRVEFGYFPWKRSYHNAENGLWDGTFLWFDLPSRRRQFYVSDSVVQVTYVFFHLKRFAFDWKTINDLKGLRIGGTLSYDYGEMFQTAEKTDQIHVVRKPDDAENFIRLFSCSIQIFPCDLEAGYELIRKHFEPAEAVLFTHHARPVKEAPHHLLLSKKIERNQQMIIRFNAGLKRLKASGRYDQFFAESRNGDYQMKNHSNSAK